MSINIGDKIEVGFSFPLTGAVPSYMAGTDVLVSKVWPVDVRLQCEVSDYENIEGEMRPFDYMRVVERLNSHAYREFRYDVDLEDIGAWIKDTILWMIGEGVVGFSKKQRLVALFVTVHTPSDEIVKAESTIRFDTLAPS